MEAAFRPHSAGNAYRLGVITPLAKQAPRRSYKRRAAGSMRHDTSAAETARALLCIDMQNDFCLEDAPLRVNGAMECLPYCQQAVALARKHAVPLIWVLREHHPQGSTTDIAVQCMQICSYEVREGCIAILSPC
jgi:hypothetical protein